MVGHPAERVNFTLVALETFTNEVIQLLSVAVIFKDFLLVIKLIANTRY